MIHPSQGEKLYRVRFAEPVLDALEHKIAVRGHYPSGMANARLATL